MAKRKGPGRRVAKVRRRKAARRSRLPGILLRTVLALLGIVAGLVVAEVAVRVIDVQPCEYLAKYHLVSQDDPSLSYHCYSSDPAGVFERVPDVETGAWRLDSCLLPPTEVPLSEAEHVAGCVEYDLNPDGFRDREYGAAPGTGTVRLLVIGDSFVKGEGVRVDRTLPKQMEELLGRDRYEVVNGGLAGVDLAERAERLRAGAQGLGCRSAVVVLTPRDADVAGAPTAPPDLFYDLVNVRDEYLAAHEEGKWYHGGPLVARLLGANLAMRGATRRALRRYRELYDPEANAAGMEDFSDTLRAIAEIPDCRVAVVIYPLMVGLEKRYPLAAVHDRIRVMAEEAGLPVLDLASYFTGAKPRYLRVHAGDHHPNGEAHAIAAKMIVDWLKAEHTEFLTPTG